MSYTVQPDPAPASEILQEELEHQYFVQLAPSPSRLVPGMITQDNQPTTGNWMDVANVDRDFPVRYFVQYTNFNTLVPGSLIQATRLPKGNWKEIKKPTIRLFTWSRNR